MKKTIKLLKNEYIGSVNLPKDEIIVLAFERARDLVLAGSAVFVEDDAIKENKDNEIEYGVKEEPEEKEVMVEKPTKKRRRKKSEE